MSWQNYPLLRILIPLILGMLFANETISVLCRHVPLIFTILCSSAAFLYTQNKRKSRDSFFSMFGVAAMLFFFTLGATLFVIRFDSLRDTNNLRKDSSTRGIVCGLPSKKPNTWGVELEVGDRHVLAYLNAGADSAEVSKLNVGDTVMFRTREFVSTCPLELQSADSVFAGYRRYLFNNGISATCYVPRRYWRIEEMDSGKTNVLRTLYSWRKSMSETYHNAGFEGEEGALIDALTTGNKAVLGKELKTHYSRAGISHILALSGFHLSVIYAMLNQLLLGRVAVLRRVWLRNVLIVASLWVFTLLAGAPPSLVRSAIMCSLMSVAPCFGRESLSVNSMTFAATVMLVFNPLVLMDAGFQLSFVSVLGICLIARPLNERLRVHPIADFFVGAVIVSAVCSVFTAPLVAYHFHSVPLLSVLTNLLVGVLSVVILYAAGLWWLLYWWEAVRDILTEVLTLSASWMNSTAEWVSSISWATFTWHPSPLSLALSYLVIAAASFCYYKSTPHRIRFFLLSVIVFSVYEILTII